MSYTTLERIEALYYEGIEEIPDSVECVSARAALKKLVESGGALDENTLCDLEVANQKHGFVYGFRAAARMSELLSKGAAV